MRIKVDQQEYYFLVSGQGKPAWLFLHGFMGSHNDFSEVTQNLLGQTLIPDLLGHGQTTKSYDSNDYKIEKQADDLADLLDKFRVDQVVVVGYSMGGRLALDFALRHSEMVAALVLESSTPGITDPQQRQARIEHDELQAQQLENGSFAEFIVHWEQLPLFASQKKLLPKIRRSIRHQREMQDPQALAASLRGMGTGSMPNLWRSLSQLDCRTVLITGEFDKKFRKLTNQMKELLPNVQRIVVEGAGHNVHLEQPECYVQILREVMKVENC